MSAIIQGWTYERWPIPTFEAVPQNLQYHMPGILCFGNDELPDRTLGSSWRARWPWAVFAVENCEPGSTTRLPYRPRFLTTNGWRRAWREATTPFIALRVGPEPVTFAFERGEGRYYSSAPRRYFSARLEVFPLKRADILPTLLAHGVKELPLVTLM
jgi:hypothetical protein